MTAEVLAFPPPARPNEAAAAMNQRIAAAVEVASRDERARCVALADITRKAARFGVQFALSDSIAGGMSPEAAIEYVLVAASPR